MGRIAQAGILADRRALSNLRSHSREINFARRNDILSTVNFRISSIDHVQIAAPAGCEQIARDFYGSLLGMVEIAKPAVLRARGGCWFQCGAQQLHVGVEKSFQPAEKAHPAFAVNDLDGCVKLCRRAASPRSRMTLFPAQSAFTSTTPGAIGSSSSRPGNNLRNIVDQVGPPAKSRFPRRANRRTYATIDAQHVRKSRHMTLAARHRVNK